MSTDTRGLFSIGEFSRVTGITVKSLRFYQDERLLMPSFVDPQSGYRYYDPSLIERARVIVYLRGLEFPIDEIRELLEHVSDDAGVLDAMERQRDTIQRRVRELRGVVRSLDEFIQQERQGRSMMQTNEQVQEKTLDPLWIAGVRMKGRYADCGKGFAKIGRSFGRFIAGPCMLLHYDTEYKEDDADFEACMPIKQAKSIDGVVFRQLPAGRCVSLIHKGPYDQMGPSYAKVIKYAKDKGYEIFSPTREVYIKGPGMIFKGNPKNYITEIQIPIHPAPAS
jgi:DNA-binding transcriptional MerR regulator/effector-binding domain-containing protein